MKAKERANLLVVVGVVELRGHIEDSVQDSRGVPHVPLLFLPLNIKIPEPVRVEVQTCCRNCILKHAEIQGKEFN